MTPFHFLVYFDFRPEIAFCSLPTTVVSCPTHSHRVQRNHGGILVRLFTLEVMLGFRGYKLVITATSAFALIVSCTLWVSSCQAEGSFNMGTLSEQVQLISHTHGRLRRRERGIAKQELLAALKHGRKQEINPGLDGKSRWKFIHKGIAFITDHTMKHEITSWHIEDDSDVFEDRALASGQLPDWFVHVIFIVDTSGSMRSSDVPGYDSRLHAVFESIRGDFITQQAKIASSKVRTSLILMSQGSTVHIKHRIIDQEVATVFESLSADWLNLAKGDGNYLPALNSLKKFLQSIPSESTGPIQVTFLSDGAPSDHTSMQCDHGTSVWQKDPNGGSITDLNGFRVRPLLQQCPWSSGANSATCRQWAKTRMERQVIDSVQQIGDLVGRDRITLRTVAFGPPKLEYNVLKDMAASLPQGHFQKLGLSASGLATMMSSVSCMTTSLAGVENLTERRKQIEARGKRGTDGWDGYILAASRGANKTQILLNQMSRGDFASSIRSQPEQDDILNLQDNSDFVLLSKRTYDLDSKKLVDTVLSPCADGVAISKNYFAEGAEHLVYYCSEINSVCDTVAESFVGSKLVAKVPRFDEWCEDPEIHKNYYQMQANAQRLAELFNRRLNGPASSRVTFLQCSVYRVRDHRFSASGSEGTPVVVELELAGRYVKWNNNDGKVHRPTGLGQPGVDSDTDDSCQSESRGDDGSDTEAKQAPQKISAADVPQCFSHFTHSVTEGKHLVCDLQGVWNRFDGYVLTDPVILKKTRGFQKFFETHVCNSLCVRLGLVKPPTEDEEEEEENDDDETK